ncbi:MAG: glycosyltransferase family 2 protein [Planctomycetia bacterium]|nr:glycosyltransferase family 2 protein [Planctomycetia bacterium]
MTLPLRTPVAVVLFNRPDRIRELLTVLRQVRPPHVLVVADGPRSGHPGDEEACRLARGVLDAIDWPCRVERDEAAINLGCDRRMTSGLDWVFSRVDRAIILEDDVLPAPGFFPWAERMLDRHEHDETIAMVSGHNPLGVWGDPTQDMLRVQRASVWGWATWANAWRRTAATDLDGDPSTARDEIGRTVSEALLANHLSCYLEAWRQDRLSAWDLIWSVQMGLRGESAIVSPVNLVQNRGMGADSTRTAFEDDFTAAVPVGNARAEPAGLATTERENADPAFDRAWVLVELLARCANPQMAVRLARRHARGTPLPLDGRLRHHLLPFQLPAESLALLEHLAAAGLPAARLDGFVAALRDALPAAVAS